MTTDQTASEQVVLLDETKAPCGVADKATVHTEHTPLHLAFSCYVIDSDGRVLVTRRALTKLTFPGVWTNSMCGHPGPGETPEEALVRRGAEELGMSATDFVSVECILPDFEYRAADSAGVVEWEVCPVFVARVAPGARIEFAPDEVDAFEWVSARALIEGVQATPFAFSPWIGEQLSHAPLREALLGF
ncbi:MAG: isopentenyl-diphosphate Delta-isomerase [Corynebacterium pyruviciproducens]|uniref:Isopentenyl-diphosphate Delta-isomerase n=1 Tax=Corynebacterium pyruviciproducens TaxID=598660 RepID=A0AAF1BSJ9_9CORY|nr:isopentenyl-diphosphate Delta-isomerase [Corynebacterium pyruviciproducens]WOT02838.1 isopentenyl-diphosphate Delta-isomerase [Corynebacterium pyruviciproducens]